MLNLSTVLESAARRDPGKAAVLFGDTEMRFGELDAAASRVAAGLIELGVEPGDRVAISCPNLPWFPVAYFGILKAGAVVVPLSVLLKGREIAYHLADSGAVAYLCFEGTPELPMLEEGRTGFEDTASCRHLVAITGAPAAAVPDGCGTTLGRLAAGPDAAETVATSPDDTAVILYTSGTTGTPKGAELTHANIVMNAKVSAEMLRFDAEDVALMVLPLFHSFAQVVLMCAGFSAGVTLVVQLRFDPGTVLAAMEKHGVTVFAGVPTMYWGLLHSPEAERFDLAAIAARLRIAVSGGASLPLEVLRSFEDRFDVPILEGYGLSEASPVASFNHLDRERKPGTVGTPIWGVEIRLADADGNEPPPGEPGEILIRGHNVMKGYWARPEATAETLAGGWLHTGDVATVDEDGYYSIVDRTKDMIIRGGFNVYPREIEEVMMEHPAVSLVAVIGIPDAEHGEEIAAYVVPAEGADLGEADLVAWCRERMAAYKYPRSVTVREGLPMNATGKILKRELRDEVSGS